MHITSEEIRKRARKLEREGIAMYWTAWVVIPAVVAVYVRSLLHLRDPLLIAGIALGLATFLMIAGALVRYRPARISPAQPCLDFVRNRIQAKHRGAMWIRRSLLLAVPAVLCCWAARPGASPLPFVAVAVGIAFCWYAFWHEGRRMHRALSALAKD